MAKVSFGSKWGRVSATSGKGGTATGKTAEEVVRDLKKAAQKPSGENYRERSLALHGFVCARCGREFGGQNRQLLTVHHKDGNHLNNPPDGSNWENLCAYCHEDVHSRGVLGDYLEGAAPSREATLVFRDDDARNGPASGLNALGEKLRRAMEEKRGK
jgi:hypothetical protein